MVFQVTTNKLSNLTEKQILNRLAMGERNAFWTIWQQHQDYLFACCLKWTNGNSTEAEDLLSEGMIKAWEKAAKYAEKIANFKYWVRKLIRNLWLDIKRRQSADQVEDIEIYADQDDLGMVSVDHTPQIALEYDEKTRVIRSAIDELPTKMRETFIGHFYQELSYQEIGKKQDISYQNVCKRISMARAILVKNLRGYFIGEAGIPAELGGTPPLTKLKIEEIPLLNQSIKAITGEKEPQKLDLCESNTFLNDIAVTSESKLEVSTDGSQSIEVVVCERNLPPILPRTQFYQEFVSRGRSCGSVRWWDKQHQMGKFGGDSVSLLFYQFLDFS